MKALEKDRNRRYETAKRLRRGHPALPGRRAGAGVPAIGLVSVSQVRPTEQDGAGNDGVRAVFHRVALGRSRLGGARPSGSRATVRPGPRGQAARDRAGTVGVLAQAETYLGEGEKQMDKPARWQMTVALAEGAARRAEGLVATGDATAGLAARSRQVQDAVKAARQDSDMLVELDRIQLEKEKTAAYPRAGAAPRYPALFRYYGVDPAAPAAAAERVLSSRLREALLAALDDWWRVTLDAVERQQLEVVLQKAEPAADAFRQRWVAAVRRADGPALAQLAEAPAVQALPVLAIPNLARNLQYANQLPAAERLLRAWQWRYPGNFWLNHSLAGVLMQQRRAGEAVRFMTAALALRSDSPDVYFDLSHALGDSNDVEGAIRASQAAVAVSPEHAAGRRDLALSLLERGDIEGAIRKYRDAIRINPNDAFLRVSLAKALSRKGDMDGAASECQAALKINPNHAEAHNGMGNLLWGKNDLVGAIREFQAAIKADANYSIPHRNLGEILLKKNDVEGAIRELRTALKINPEWGEFHFVLAQCLHAKNDLDGAISEYRAALEALPQ